MKKRIALLSMLMIAMVLCYSTPVSARVSDYYNSSDAASYAVDISSSVREQRIQDLIRMCQTERTWLNDAGTSSEVDAVYNSSWIWSYVSVVPSDRSLLPGQYFVDGSKGYYGSECFGFANFALWYVSASSSNTSVWQYLAATPAKIFDYANVSQYVQRGDVLRLSQRPDEVNCIYHSVFVDRVDSDGIMVCDANAVQSQGLNRLHYRKLLYSDIYNYFTITRAYVNVVNDSNPSQTLYNPAFMSMQSVASGEEGYYASGTPKYSSEYGYNTNYAAGWFVKWCADRAGITWADPVTAASVTSAFNYATSTGNYHGNATQTWYYNGKSGTSVYDPNFNTNLSYGAIVFLETDGASGLPDGPDSIGVVVGTDYGMVRIAYYNSSTRSVNTMMCSGHDVSIWGYYIY